MEHFQEIPMTDDKNTSSQASNTSVSKGRAWVFGDNINTDIMIPFRFKSRTNDPYEWQSMRF